MGENTSQIERQISDERSELGRNLRELETKARDLTDWRQHHRNHPGVTMGLAFSGGLILGLLTLPRRGYYDYDGEIVPFDTLRERVRAPGVVSTTKARAGQHLGQTWEHIADALLGVVSAKAIEFIGDLVPGFRNQFQPARTQAPEYRRQPYETTG